VLVAADTDTSPLTSETRALSAVRLSILENSIPAAVFMSALRRESARFSLEYSMPAAASTSAFTSREELNTPAIVLATPVPRPESVRPEKVGEAAVATD